MLAGEFELALLWFECDDVVLLWFDDELRVDDVLLFLLNELYLVCWRLKLFVLSVIVDDADVEDDCCDCWCVLYVVEFWKFEFVEYCEFGVFVDGYTVVFECGLLLPPAVDDVYTIFGVAYICGGGAVGVYIIAFDGVGFVGAYTMVEGCVGGGWFVMARFVLFETTGGGCPYTIDGGGPVG